MPDHKRDCRLYKLRHKYANLSESTWVAVVQADPSPTRKYVSWIIERCSEEDFPAVRDALARYDALKPRLPAEKRNILQYASLKALQDVVRDFSFMESQKTSRKQKKEIIASARQESIHLTGEDIALYFGENITVHPGMTVDIPLTIKANQTLGRNTKWCTSATMKNSLYRDYCDGFLVIFGFYVQGGGYQRFQAYMSTEGSPYLCILPEANQWDEQSKHDVAPFIETIYQVLISLHPEHEEFIKAYRIKINETHHIDNILPVVRLTMQEFLDNMSAVLDKFDEGYQAGVDAYSVFLKETIPSVILFQPEELISIANLCFDLKNNSLNYDKLTSDQGVFVNFMSAQVLNAMAMIGGDLNLVMNALGYDDIVNKRIGAFTLDDMKHIYGISKFLEVERQVSIDPEATGNALDYIVNIILGNDTNIGRMVYGPGYEKVCEKHIDALSVAYFFDASLFYIKTDGYTCGSSLQLFDFMMPFSYIKVRHFVLACEMLESEDSILQEWGLKLLSSTVMNNVTFSLENEDAAPWIRHFLKHKRRYEGRFPLKTIKFIMEWSLSNKEHALKELLISKVPMLFDTFLENCEEDISISAESSIEDIRNKAQRLFLKTYHEKKYPNTRIFRLLMWRPIYLKYEEDSLLLTLNKYIFSEYDRKLKEGAFEGYAPDSVFTDNNFFTDNSF